MKRIISFIYCIGIAISAYAETNVSLNSTEKNIVAYINENQNQALTLLAEWVNINSATDNIEGLEKVGNLIQKEFEKLGFVGEWKKTPKEMTRAGTLILKREGTQGHHLLLIAHMDTVFPKTSAFQTYSQQDAFAQGPGVADDKGGIITILYALKALDKEGLLKNTRITIALTSDEENPGKPISVSRAPLIQAAQDVDIALDFEPAASLNQATIARRGISVWEIHSNGKEAHSFTIFQAATGNGAIFEMSRILDAGRKSVSTQEWATFNPGVIVGGTTAEIDTAGNVIGYGAYNVVAQTAFAKGDIRFISNEQRENLKKTLQDITQQSLPGTNSSISFVDGAPAMPPTENNKNLLSFYSKISKDLGFEPVTGAEISNRGAADLNYVVDIVPANLGGLGAVGTDTHTPHEKLDIESLNINTQRAAILIYRLTQ